uniref:60S ribosomal protein L29 n=1 Tax=Panagrellus redivivus TaxID=6233 RepID=A0A7E4VM53_PANRE
MRTQTKLANGHEWTYKKRAWSGKKLSRNDARLKKAQSRPAMIEAYPKCLLMKYHQNRSPIGLPENQLIEKTKTAMKAQRHDAKESSGKVAAITPDDKTVLTGRAVVKPEGRKREGIKAN